MNDIERITTVLVDTCSFRDANSDFIGVNSMLLPSFFSAIYEKKMLLLTHPIIEKEIEKHIEDSGLYKDFQKLLSQLKKCKDVLKYAKCSDEVLFSNMAEFDIKSETFKAYKEYIKNAFRLGYPEPELIFNLYFSAEPPFALTGDKKREFPDAFVIEATKKYISEHPNDILLIVSKDKDWKNSFFDFSEVIMCESINEALKKINSIESILSEEMLSEIFRGAYNDILSSAKFSAECECYELDDYEFIEDLKIDNIEIEEVKDSFVPLKISREMILIKTMVSINVSGHGEIFDEERSIWDYEEDEYFSKEYSAIEFMDGNGKVECEVQIKFDFDNPENYAEVESFKLNNRGNICISSNSIKMIPIDWDDLKIRGLREDKGYSQRC